MKRFWANLIFVALFGLWLPGAAHAFWPLLQDVQVWFEGKVFNWKVYDPQLQRWQSASSLSHDSFPDSGVTNGIVFYQYREGNSITGWKSTLVWAVYDPQSHDWRTASSFSRDVIHTTIVNEGIVAYVYREGNSVSGWKDKAEWSIYDPQLQQWKSGSSFSQDTIALIVKDGVVAYKYREGNSVSGWQDKAEWAIYDPQLHHWQSVSSTSHPIIGNLSIQNGTVSYTASGTTRSSGYDPGSRGWYSGPTKPLAHFFATPASGSPPLWVWFWDLSLGATSWSWNFADGSTGGERSGYHTFTGIGVFPVNQSVNGPQGSSSARTNIITDVVAPSGSIVIHSGSNYTATRSVNLTVSATDNSGSVAAMQFGNVVSSWSGWETYATSKAWTLPAGDGTKTVYVQFKDAADKVSANYSDTIILDTAPPAGSVQINDGAVTTASGSVTLKLAAQDNGGSGVAQMRFSHDGTIWSDWEAFAASKGWTLLPGEGERTVFVQFKDAVGNASSSFSDGIVVGSGTPTGPPIWNLAEDFRIAPNQENPIRDRNNNSVWYLFRSSGAARDANYTLFDSAREFSTTKLGANTSTFFTPSATYGIPFIGKNHSGSTLFNIFGANAQMNWPNGAILVHPGFSSDVIVAWRSPISGTVSISGGVTDQDNGSGNGIAWFIDKNSSPSTSGNLASGLVNNGGAQLFSAGTGGSALANVAVGAGDFVYFVVGRNGDASYDSTRLDIVIQSLTQAAGNRPPSAPGNISPADGATDQSLSLTLQTTAFSDADGDTHAASQWQVLDHSGTTVLWDSGEDTVNKTSRSVPAAQLANATNYRWQVRYRDSHGAWSAYSAATSFTTTTAPNNPPATPGNSSPTNGAADQSLTLILQSSAFNDPDGDTHAASQWLLWEIQTHPTLGRISVTKWDSGEETANKTSRAVPAGLLAAARTYGWQVRYRDTRGAWSAYSAITEFTTAAVAKMTPTITWPRPAAITYGTALGAAQLNAQANVPGTFVYSPPAGTVLNAGPAQTLSVSFVPTDTAAYDNAPASVQVDVAKAVLTVRADDKNKVSGTANPALTASYSGFVNGEGTQVLSGQPDLSTTASSASGPGTYPINVSAGTLAATNYGFLFVNGTLTVATPPANTAYFADFEQGIGPEWSAADLENSYPGVFSQFTGRFGNATQTLTLNNLAAGQPHELEFDFYMIDSWDGTGEDNAFKVSLDGVQVFRETFYSSPNPGPELQSFRGLPVSGWVHLGFTPHFLDAIYRDIKINFTPANSTVQIAFSGQLNQPLNDESWGIDNVSVAPKTATNSPPDTTAFPQPPLTPNNLLPPAGAQDQRLTLILQSSAFSDPDGDSHAASQWQVLDSSGASVVWDSGEDAINKASRSIPSGVLVYSMTYRWQVRYKDGRNVWSSYSATTTFTTATPANNPPITPTNIRPATGAIGQPLTLTLQSSAFSDPDGDSHAASQWQVLENTGTTLIWDSGADTNNIVSRSITSNLLAHSTTYRWQVRHLDSRGAWSAYSPASTFTTVAAPTEPTAIIFQNRSDYPALAVNTTFSGVGDDDPGFQTFDDFQLNSPARITKVRWVGFYWDANAPTNNPVAPQTRSWQLGFYADASGLPGSLLKEFSLAPGSVSIEMLGNATANGDPVRVYMLVAELPVPYAVETTTRLWFSVRSAQSTLIPVFIWLSGSGGVGDSIQISMSDGERLTKPNNRAFTFEGELITAQPVTPTISWSNPPDIIYGTALTSRELNATASAPGTLTYNPSAGTVLPAGEGQTLSVSFVPSDPARYRSASATVRINVPKAPLTVTADSKSKVQGEANPPLTTSYRGFVNGEGVTVLTGQPSLSTTATATSTAGSYPINISAGTLSAANYSFNFVSGTLTVTAPPVARVTLDVDGSGVADAATDGVMILRYLFGFTPAVVIRDALGAGATRTTEAAVINHLSELKPLLDVDDNGRIDALTDGLLIARFLRQLPGDALIGGAVDSNARRVTAAAIEDYLRALMPVAVNHDPSTIDDGEEYPPESYETMFLIPRLPDKLLPNTSLPIAIQTVGGMGQRLSRNGTVLLSLANSAGEAPAYNYVIAPSTMALTDGIAAGEIIIQTPGNLDQIYLAAEFVENALSPMRLQRPTAALKPTRQIFKFPPRQPWRYPLPAPTRVSGTFGEWPGHSDKHRGIDLAAAPDTEVRAVVGGLVTVANRTSPLGTVVVHDGYGQATKYLHIVPEVVENQWIDAGKAIGRVRAGSHPHLHFEVRQDERTLSCDHPTCGQAINPVRLMPALAQGDADPPEILSIYLRDVNPATTPVTGEAPFSTGLSGQAFVVLKCMDRHFRLGELAPTTVTFSPEGGQASSIDFVDGRTVDGFFKKPLVPGYAELAGANDTEKKKHRYQFWFKWQTAAYRGNPRGPRSFEIVLRDAAGNENTSNRRFEFGPKILNKSELATVTSETFEVQIQTKLGPLPQPNQNAQILDQIKVSIDTRGMAQGSASLQTDVPWDVTQHNATRSFSVRLSDNAQGTLRFKATSTALPDLEDEAIIQVRRQLPGLSVADVAMQEGNAGTVVANFMVSLSQTSTVDVAVDFATVDGSAIAPSDYTTGNGKLTIPAGNSSGFISILINGDTAVEPDETFGLTLSNPLNATLTKAVGTGTIQNDDALPQFANLSVSTGGKGSGTISLNPPGGVYSIGTVVQLSAVTNQGSIFVGWEGAVTGNANPALVTMDRDKSVQAIFELSAPLPQTHKLTIFSSGTGDGVIGLEPMGNGTNPWHYSAGRLVMILPLPDQESTFLRWEGAVTGTNNPLFLTMDSDKELTAIWERPLTGKWNGRAALMTDVTGATCYYSGNIKLSLNQRGTALEGVIEYDLIGDPSNSFFRCASRIQGANVPLTGNVDGANMKLSFTTAAPWAGFVINAEGKAGFFEIDGALKKGVNGKVSGDMQGYFYMQRAP